MNRIICHGIICILSIIGLSGAISAADDNVQTLMGDLVSGLE